MVAGYPKMAANPDGPRSSAETVNTRSSVFPAFYGMSLRTDSREHALSVFKQEGAKLLGGSSELQRRESLAWDSTRHTPRCPSEWNCKFFVFTHRGLQRAKGGLGSVPEASCSPPVAAFVLSRLGYRPTLHSHWKILSHGAGQCAGHW